MLTEFELETMKKLKKFSATWSRSELGPKAMRWNTARSLYTGRHLTAKEMTAVFKLKRLFYVVEYENFILTTQGRLACDIYHMANGTEFEISVDGRGTYTTGSRRMSSSRKYCYREGGIYQYYRQNWVESNLDYILDWLHDKWPARNGNWSIDIL
jgi:hypothetical protein